MSILRSVHDYPTEEALREALQTPLDEGSASGENSEGGFQHGLDPRLEWVVEGYDKDDSHPQMLEMELRRLAVLKSYRISGSGRNKDCERLLSLICRIVKAPMALVSVMDMGFQYLIATRGLKDWREVPRKACICAHALISKSDMLIVNDLSKDERFKNFASVTDFPYLRFYASTPLLSPEGFRLGTVCVLDSEPRPQGLTLEEKQNIREITDMVMDAMVEHREMTNHEMHNPSQVIACTSNDLLTPLKGVMDGLGTIRHDERLLNTLTKQQREVFSTAVGCTTIMDRVCRKSLKTFQRGHPFIDDDSSNTESGDEKLNILTISELIKHLHVVMEPFPKQVPMVITADSDVPPVVVADSLKIFRSAVNLLTNACKHTERGSVHLRIYVEPIKNGNGGTGEGRNNLVFAVEDCGSGVSVDQYQHLFRPVSRKEENRSQSPCEDEGSLYDRKVAPRPARGKKGMGLYSVATLIGSIGGQYGFQPREFTSIGSQSLDTSGHPKKGSLFWFSIPLVVKDELDTNDSSSSDQLQEQFLTEEPLLIPATTEPYAVSVQSLVDLDQGNEISDSARSSTGRRRRALIIEDSLTCRKTLTRQLAKLGFETTQVVNGMEGLKALQATLFDVTFCDFLMPVADGIDCVEQYRSFELRARPWFDQFIVGISAHADEQSIERGLQAGMNDFRPKPLTDKDLQEIFDSQDFEYVSSRLDSIEAQRRPDGEQKGITDSSNLSERSESLRPLYCLIAEEGSVLSKLAEMHATSRALKIVTVHDGETALQLLKMRNWDAVFLDDEMAGLISSKCVTNFREWEKKNRVKRQNNVVQMSSSFIPKVQDSTSVQLPSGFDAAVGKPISAEILFDFLDDIRRGGDSCISNDILSR